MSSTLPDNRQPRKKSGKLGTMSTTTPNDLVESDQPVEEEAHLPMATPGLGHQLTMLAAVIFPLIGVVLAMVMLSRVGWFQWYHVAMVVVGWLMTGLGITVGFHRLLTHKSFETYPWMRAMWMGLGAVSIEGSPMIWCAVHRRHHQVSDKEGDPHSPNLHGSGIFNALHGAWHGHTGWLLTSHWPSIDLERYVPDLMQERFLCWINRYYYLFVLASLLIPAAIGGLIEGTLFGAFLGLLWGGLVRIFVTHHITWSVNSICHLFGKQPYKSNDQSRNNVIVGFLAMGEGWHNNHHAFPTSARHGLLPGQFDLSWTVIFLMSKIGLAWNIKLPSERQMESRAIEASRSGIR